MSERIVFLVPNLLPGGAERVLVNLVHEFTDHGIECEVIVKLAVGAYVQELPASVPVSAVGGGSMLITTWRIQKHLRQRPATYAITFLDPVAFPMLMASVFLPTRVIVTVHNAIVKPKHESHRLRSRFKPWVARLLYPLADSIVGVSEDLSKHLREVLWFGQGKVKTIYNPIFSLATFERDWPLPNHVWFQARKGERVIVSIGRFIAQKGFDVLLDSFRDVSRQCPEARLVILGAGRLESQIKEQATRLQLDDKVWFPGFVSDPASYLANADLFVLSSRWEGLPTTLIEALGCGVPCVATDCPFGPREILAGGQFGRLVPPENAAALSEAIVDSLKCAPFSSKELRARAAHFSAESSRQAYLALMPELRNSL